MLYYALKLEGSLHCWLVSTKLLLIRVTKMHHCWQSICFIYKVIQQAMQVCSR